MNFMTVSSSSFGVGMARQLSEGRNINSTNCYWGHETCPKWQVNQWFGLARRAVWGCQGPGGGRVWRLIAGRPAAPLVPWTCPVSMGGIWRVCSVSARPHAVWRAMPCRSGRGPARRGARGCGPRVASPSMAVSHRQPGTRRGRGQGEAGGPAPPTRSQTGHGEALEGAVPCRGGVATQASPPRPGMDGCGVGVAQGGGLPCGGGRVWTAVTAVQRRSGVGAHPREASSRAPPVDVSSRWSRWGLSPCGWWRVAGPSEGAGPGNTGGRGSGARRSSPSRVRRW